MRIKPVFQLVVCSAVSLFAAFGGSFSVQADPEISATPKVDGEESSASGTVSPADNSAARVTNIGLRVDCLHNFNQDKGATQQCTSITGLRYTYFEQLSTKVSAMIRLDPFGTPVSSRRNSPDRSNLPIMRDTEFILIDDYALLWSPRPNLGVAIEDYSGATAIPSTSGLALASRLNDTGWDQTAVTVTYNLPSLRDMRVKFAAGNGEGENGQNMDPQQYFGFEMGATILTGIKANIGVSMDGNNIGSAQHEWELKQYEERCGFDPASFKSKLGYSMQRLGIGLEIDGNLPAARGLRVGLGWQRSTAADLSKEQSSGPVESELKGCVIDVDNFFVEDPTKESANTVERTVIGLNASYRIMDRYFFGIDYENRKIDTDKSKLFTICEGFTGTNCTTSGEDTNNLTQTAYTVGGGVDLDEGLTLSLEYNKTTLDKVYSKVYYLNRNGKTSDALELFNARLAYNWK